MAFLIMSFLVSLAMTLFIVRSNIRHLRHADDHDLSGPQKFHARPVPRIGGLAIFIAVGVGTTLLWLNNPRDARLLLVLLGVGLPAFLAGLLEDLTKRVSPRRRLIATAASASLAAVLLGAVLTRTDIPGVDMLIAIPAFAFALTILCVTGVANAVNIIDGFNGLAAMCVTIILLAVAYVALKVGDTFILTSSLIVVGAVLGFFICNFPAGLVFLGDGGAYFLGFVVAELNVLLIVRNPSVSPLFALLTCAYPIFETLFTIYRRKVLKGVPTGAPDAIHLHTLIHRRIVRHLLRDVGGDHERRQTARNSMTSPYLWLVCALSVIPAVLWWKHSSVLTAFLLLFMVTYVAVYWSIVRFRALRFFPSFRAPPDARRFRNERRERRRRGET